MTVYMRGKSGTVFTTENPLDWPECERLSQNEGQKAMRADSLESLRGILAPGSTVYCVLRSVSKSGMSRRIDFFAIHDDQMRYLSDYIADVLSDVHRDDKQGLRVNGGGMDIGFHVVYGLGRAMWPNGTPAPHGRRNGEPDSDGGYALKHEWL